MSSSVPQSDQAAARGALRPHNARVFDGFVYLSNDIGESVWMSPENYEHLRAGQPLPDALLSELSGKGFLSHGMSLESYAQHYWERRQPLFGGPVLHGMVLTERCNHGCQYCHSSVVGMNRTDTDMSLKVAERSVDFALSTPSPGLTIEFQGGEPLANWDTLVHTVAYAQLKNRQAKKDLAFSLVTNLSLMTDDKLDFLLANRVQICTSLDGPAELHNKIRILRQTSGNSHAYATTWLRKINDRYAEMGLDPNLYRAEALPTITRAALPYSKEIIDTYVDLGCRAIFLRVLDPFGFAAITHQNLGYSMEDFLSFYREALDYILELNRQGVQVMERLAAIMLSKIMAHYEPNYLDLRSPGGAVLGQLAYHPSGDIYSSDEGRMVAAMGDEVFKLGNVHESSYQDLVRSPKSRALILASTNDNLPGCTSCAYKPFCGQQPEYNYATQGSIHGRMLESTWCKKHMGIFDYLVERLYHADDEERSILERWTINRAQDHFLQSVE